MEKEIMFNLSLNLDEVALLTDALYKMNDHLERLNAMQMSCQAERTALKDSAVLGGIFQKLSAETGRVAKLVREGK